jgi:hypothetical protein
MIYGSFIHGDDNIFRTTVSEFVNDTKIHPIVKYKAFIGVFLFVLSGMIILGLIYGGKIFGHKSWRHLFAPVSDIRDSDATDTDIFNYSYGGRTNNKSGAAIFREAIEGFDVNKLPPEPKVENGKVIDKRGGYVSADVKGAEQVNATKKKTPCATDCGQYLDLKTQITTLSKIVDAVKDQQENIKKTASDIQALGKQVEDLNTSLSPGGQVDIQL